MRTLRAALSGVDQIERKVGAARVSADPLGPFGRRCLIPGGGRQCHYVDTRGPGAGCVHPRPGNQVTPPVHAAVYAPAGLPVSEPPAQLL